MRHWVTLFDAVVVLAIVAVLAAACKSHGSLTGLPVPAGSPLVTVDVPPAMHGIVPATWTASWVGGSGPYTIEWNFGGGAEDQGPEPTTSPANVVVEMINLSGTSSVSYTYTVTVKDALGRSGTATGRYSIGVAFIPNVSIDAVDIGDNTMTVTVSHPWGLDITVAPSPVDGLSFTPASVIVPDGLGDAVFHWSANNVLSGGCGTTTIAATGEYGVCDTADQAISVMPLALEDDTLYFVPLANKAQVGEPVRFACATGTLPNPFQFVNGVGVTFEQDAELVAGSFNVGMEGGDPFQVDGSVWTAVNPGWFLSDGSHSLSVVTASSASVTAGRGRWDFNLSPVGGSDANGAKGQLFNVEFTFREPGLKHVGLVAIDGVNRSYYSDSTSTEYLWGTLMADEHGNLNVEGVDNSVLVE